MMKTLAEYSFIVLTFIIVSCSRVSMPGNMSSGTLKIVDDMTNDVRKHESVTLTFTSADGNVFTSTRNTDEAGCIYFKTSQSGTYTASFSYYEGTARDCFMEFAFDAGKENQEFVMTVAPEIKAMDAEIVITGFMPDIKGSDSGHEYMQFMALTDLDFEKNPYSVIACRNNAVNAQGWVQGSYVTYKFNLTSGSVRKGQFFYVGGLTKKLNGASSADISRGLWISSVDYVNKAGADGVGDKTVGYLHNPNSNSNNNIADGIAVFKGTDVRPDTVPIDVIFYGALINSSVYNPAGFGYMVCNNDLYSTVNVLNGEQQPFFGQGTNAFMFKDPANDAGEFVALGGIFTDGGYIKGRSATYIKCPVNQDIDGLSLIEESEGTSVFMESN